MANKEDIRDVEEEDTDLETLEYTDEEGQEHIFVIDAKFDIGGVQYAALFEVDPALFDEDHEHDHDHEEEHDHDQEDEFEPDNLVIAKMVELEDGSVDIQVPTDEEFEVAKAEYERLLDEADED
jgi:hypothetical protein